MKIIKHRFENRPVNPDSEVLIVGTFNPETPGNEAEFFYGRSRNFLWRLLPASYQQQSLKGATKQEKLDFIASNKIEFTDLIKSVKVEKEQEANYSDTYIDKHIEKTNDVVSLIKSLQNLKKVVVTRQTFSGVPKIKQQVDLIREYCQQNSIAFECLPTPARFYSEQKQQVWTKAFAL